jgi:hypothetical protein
MLREVPSALATAASKPAAAGPAIDDRRRAGSLSSCLDRRIRRVLQGLGDSGVVDDRFSPAIQAESIYLWAAASPSRLALSKNL